MKKFVDWVDNLLKDERGVASIKPVVALLGALFLGGTLICSTVTHGAVSPSSDLVNAIMVITCVGMTGDTIDKFSKKVP